MTMSERVKIVIINVVSGFVAISFFLLLILQYHSLKEFNSCLHFQSARDRDRSEEIPKGVPKIPDKIDYRSNTSFETNNTDAKQRTVQTKSHKEKAIHSNVGTRGAETDDGLGICKNVAVYISLFMLVIELILCVLFLCLCIWCCIGCCHCGDTLCCFKVRKLRKKRDIYKNITITILSEKEKPKRPKKRKHFHMESKHIKQVEKEFHTVLYEYITKMFYHTWKDKDTRYGVDAKGLSHTSVQITRIYQIVNEKLYDNYMSTHTQISPRFNEPRELTSRPISTRKIAVPPPTNRRTHRNYTMTQYIPGRHFDEIETISEPLIQPQHVTFKFLNRSEVFLFHGTRLENARDIMENGFDVSKSKRGLYGHPAIYLAESSQKADQYTDDVTNRRAKNLGMFLVRTTLGRTRMFGAETTGNPCDTTIGGSDKRFREFLKTSNTQVYPEFLVIYNRLQTESGF